MLISSFKHKPTIVKAIQYDGSNIRECLSFMTSDCQIPLEDLANKRVLTKHCAMLLDSLFCNVGDNGCNVEVNMTDWIVKDIDGKFYVYDDEKFRLSFKKEKEKK